MWFCVHLDNLAISVGTPLFWGCIWAFHQHLPATLEESPSCKLQFLNALYQINREIKQFYICCRTMYKQSKSCMQLQHARDESRASQISSDECLFEFESLPVGLHAPFLFAIKFYNRQHPATSLITNWRTGPETSLLISFELLPGTWLETRSVCIYTSGFVIAVCHSINDHHYVIIKTQFYSNTFY